MEQIVERGRAQPGERITWAIGGIHPNYADSAEITRSLQALQVLGVTDVLPTHCAGAAEIVAFEQASGEHCVSGGVRRSFASGAAR